MVVIRDMLSRMESEHKTKLEQLHVMQEQQRCHYLKLLCAIASFLVPVIANKMVMYINGDIIALNI